MKNFFCSCGQSVFFDSDTCLSCGRTLAFSLADDSMVAIEGAEQRALLCANGRDHAVCNWLVEEPGSDLCSSCRLTRTLPWLGNPKNQNRWSKLESAKRRLLYALHGMGLGALAHTHGLSFDFLEDGRSDPARYGDLYVSTGYQEGVVTVNVLEADTAAREAEREALNEQVRTLLGHMRHESGHFFFDCFKTDEQWLGEFRELFGDERNDYGSALAQYYSEGADGNWQEHYITAYASSHPLEDWAETWNHYLNMSDGLETADSYGVIEVEGGGARFPDKLSSWRKLTVMLNELNRAIGSDDAYPFVISANVEEKFAAVDRTVERFGV